MFFKLQNKLSLKIFYGHHILKINKSCELYDLLIPTTFLYERDSLLLNVFGFFTKNLFLYLSSTNIKDLAIIYKYSYFFLRKKNKNRKLILWFFFINRKVVYENILSYINLLDTYGLVVNERNRYCLYETSVFEPFLEKKLTFNFLNNSSYLFSLNNYYLITTLTKLSKNLLLGSKRFVIDNERIV